MADTNETIADIIEEKRLRAAAIERDAAEKMKSGEMISDLYARELVADIRREANRLEAALKREKHKKAITTELPWLAADIQLQDGRVIRFVKKESEATK